MKTNDSTFSSRVLARLQKGKVDALLTDAEKQGRALQTLNGYFSRVNAAKKTGDSEALKVARANKPDYSDIPRNKDGSEYRLLYSDVLEAIRNKPS